MQISKRIDGKARADRLVAAVAAATAKLKVEAGTAPGLCAVLVGEDPASQVYVRNKGKAATAAGIQSFQETLPATISEAELLALIARLNADDRVDGILVQLPLPKHIDPQRVIDAIDPAKDVDGFHAQNVGQLWSGGCASGAGAVHAVRLPALVARRAAQSRRRRGGRARALQHRRQADGGAPVVGELHGDVCAFQKPRHSRDPAPRRYSGRRRGPAELVRGSWIKEGAVVIDVGINRVAAADGKSKLVGDVAFAEAQGIAGAITPVPGGVGPMTIACLLRNTLIAACRRRGRAEPDV